MSLKIICAMNLGHLKYNNIHRTAKTAQNMDPIEALEVLKSRDHSAPNLHEKCHFVINQSIKVQIASRLWITKCPDVWPN